MNRARTSNAYVPSFELTKGQGAPIAAHGGVSYMAFDRDGDAGTTEATADALRLIATGTGQRRDRHDRERATRPDRNAVGLGLSQSGGVPRVHPRQQQARTAHRCAGRRRGVAAALHGARSAVVLDRFVECALARSVARSRRRWRCAKRSAISDGGASTSRRYCATRGASASTTRGFRRTVLSAWTTRRLARALRVEVHEFLRRG